MTNWTGCYTVSLAARRCRTTSYISGDLAQIYLKKDSPLAVITLGKQAGLGHARLGHIYVHSRPLKPLLQLHRCQLIVQLGIGVCCEVTVNTALPSAARSTELTFLT